MSALENVLENQKYSFMSNKNELGTNVDRQFLAKILRDAFGELTTRSGSQEVFAAQLGSRIRDLLRVRLQNPNVELNGSFFGPILFPHLPPLEQSKLKFKDFLRTFPEAVELVIDGTFAKVKLAELKPLRSKNGLELELRNTNKDSVPLAYLIVHSPSVLDSLHQILGDQKLTPKTLPDWNQLKRFLEGEYPAKEWRARFFMGVANTENEGGGGFRAYLDAIGYRVIQMKLERQPSIMDDLINERSRVTAVAVSRLLSEIGASVNDAHVFVVTHSPLVVDAMSDLLKKRQAHVQIGVLGFPERIDPRLIQLKENGLTVLDIETDAKIFKSTLPRQQLIAPHDFNPAKYL
jgi:hypothetical protein